MNGVDHPVPVEKPAIQRRKKTPIEDNDGRDLFSPDSRWSSSNRALQKREAIYIISLLLFAIVALCILGLLGQLGAKSLLSGFWQAVWDVDAIRYGFLAAGGLLGGTVYGAKWLYHAVAKGLWHEDRCLWRVMQPWISLGTTVGIWALIDSGFFDKKFQDLSMLGIGFAIGYLSDQFLAKMKEITNVLFGRTERHFGSGNSRDGSNS